MAKRAQRPSVKDKGVDILFPQDGGPPEAGSSPSWETDSAAGPETYASKLASKQDSGQASKQAPDADSDLDLILFEESLARIAEAGRITASFRFSESELDALDDVVYRSRRLRKVRLVKQDVVRLGLAALLAEYKERGRDSILGRYIERQKE